MAGAGGIGTDQHRPVPRGRGELREREIGQLDQIGGGVGGGVALPQDRGQRLGSAISAVQKGQQRVEAEAALERTRRALLVGVGVDQGGVQVDQQQLAGGPGASGPGACPRVRSGRAQAGQPVRIGAGPLDDPPGGRGDSAE